MLVLPTLHPYRLFKKNFYTCRYKSVYLSLSRSQVLPCSIDGDTFSRQKLGLASHQERNELGDLTGFAYSSQTGSKWMGDIDTALNEGIVLDIVQSGPSVNIGCDDSWVDVVDPNALGGKIDRGTKRRGH